jgi:hypothetical protein
MNMTFGTPKATGDEAPLPQQTRVWLFSSAQMSAPTLLL